MGLKHWTLPHIQFKTHLFFSIFGWGGPFSAWILVRRVAQTSNLSGEAIWQVSEDPYHTEFVSWRVDHFSFFYFFSTSGGGGGRRLGENSTNFFFFFEPFPKETFVEEVDLEKHLRTCETYEGRNCDIKNHIETQHANYTNLNHLKIDREREFDVKIKSYSLQEV